MMKGLAPESGRVRIEEVAEFGSLIDDTEKCMPRSSLLADIAVVVGYPLRHPFRILWSRNGTEEGC